MRKRRKIRLLHITSSLGVGGAEAVLCDLIDQLGNEEFEHHVIYFHGGLNVQRLQKSGVSLYHVQGFLFLYDAYFFLRCYAIAKKVAPDCIHSLLWMANVVARVIGLVYRVPIINVLHNNAVLNGLMRHCVERLVYNGSTRCVAVSTEVKDSFIEHYGSRFAEAKVIPNGINVARVTQWSLEQKKERSSLGFDDDHIIFGSVGRLVEVKNYFFLLKTFALLLDTHPKIRLILVGDGPLELELRASVRKLNIEHAVLFVTGQTAYGYYPLFDYFVQPSITEGVSIALLEAMVCKKPVIVAGIAGRHSVVTQGKDGIIADCSTEDSLRIDLEAVLAKDKAFCAKLAHEAHRTVSDYFSSEIMAGAYKDFMSDSLTQS